MVEKGIECPDEIREEMAHKLAPVLKDALGTAGPHTTLLEAHRCLVDPGSKLQIVAPDIGPMGPARAGVIIIITS